MFACLFSGSRIGSEEAFYLYTSGPDLTSIMPCKYGKPSVTFSKFVTQEGLKCEHVREILMKSKDVDTTTLVVSLSFFLFSFFLTRGIKTSAVSQKV